MLPVCTPRTYPSASLGAGSGLSYAAFRGWSRVVHSASFPKIQSPVLNAVFALIKRGKSEANSRLLHTAVAYAPTAVGMTNCGGIGNLIARAGK
jgi:hypothetical protein